MPPDPSSDSAPGPVPASAERRLFRRYATGLAAEIVLIGGALPCRVTDLSLGGACVELDPGVHAPTAGAQAELRAPEIANGHGFPVVVRQVLGSRVNLAFQLDRHDDFELTMFLMDNPATLDDL